jgi:hypothetical protein
MGLHFAWALWARTERRPYFLAILDSAQFAGRNSKPARIGMKEKRPVRRVQAGPLSEARENQREATWGFVESEPSL